jgi:hypothetical protein
VEEIFDWVGSLTMVDVDEDGQSLAWQSGEWRR